MTPEQIEKHKARFEALELSKGNPIHYDQINDGRYFCEYQQNRWEGYLMHAENMEVEIPSDMDFLSFPLASHYDLVKYLESQGIKIKSSGSE